jgi:hypothetical protein
MNTQPHTTTRLYGARKVPIDDAIVEKLRQLTLHAHALRSRCNALAQSADQITQKVKHLPAARIREAARQSGIVRTSNEYIAIQQRIDEIDRELREAKAHRARMMDEAYDWSQKSAPISELVRGVLRELGVNAADLSIDIVDFDQNVSMGTSRGI